MVRRPHVLPKFFDGETVISFELGTSRHAHALYEARMTFGNQAGSRMFPSAIQLKRQHYAAKQTAALHFIQHGIGLFKRASFDSATNLSFGGQLQDFAQIRSRAYR